MRRFTWMCLACLSLGATVTEAAPPNGKVVYTNKPRFRIPYHFDAEEMRKLGAREIRLYVSTDMGVRWQATQAVAPQPGKFNFQASADGEYWFCVRTLDGRNQLHPSDDGVQPGLQVVVDTVAPQLALTLKQVSPGRVRLSWNARDEHLDLARLRLEYSQPGENGWQLVQVVPKAVDYTEWNVPQGGMVAVRGAIADLAGNGGQAETRVQVAPGRGSGQEGPDFRDPVAGADFPADAQAGIRPRGRLPTAIQRNPDPTLPGNLPPLPEDPSPAVGQPGAAPPDQVAQNSDANAASGLPGFGPVIRPADPSSRSNSGFASLQQGAGQPGVRTHEAAFPQPKRDPATRIVNQRQFQIGYRLEEVGPSGISSVELFITQDNGATWYRYGEDPDKKSPFVVGVPREGTYGFTLLVRSGVGLSFDPPQPGEKPAITVAVDETAPQVHLLPVEQGRGSAMNKLLIRWMAQDENLADRPISLWYRTETNGPWQPIAGGLENTSSHVWTMPSGVAPKLFFRIEARDVAGNVQQVDTHEPLLIDLSKPTARILEVETTADSGALTFPQ